MRKITTLFRRFMAEEHGANMIEYIMIFALIALICAAGYAVLGQSINTRTSGLAEQIDSVNL